MLNWRKRPPDYFLEQRYAPLKDIKPWHWGQKDCSTRHSPEQNATQKPCSLHLQLTCSPTLTFLFHSFILSLLSSKVVALFQSIAWPGGEQCKHTLLLWILVRNPIRPSYSPYSPSLFSVLLPPPPTFFLLGLGRGNLNRLVVKANSSLFSPFFFHGQFFFPLPHLREHKHILSIHTKGQRRRERKRRWPTKAVIIDCKLRSISPSHSLLCSFLPHKVGTKHFSMIFHLMVYYLLLLWHASV